VDAAHTTLLTTYTPCTLSRFGGKGGGRILLAVYSAVSNATGGRGFYGPGKRA